MFLRLVADSFGRRPRRKILTGAALALGMAVATAALSVSLDVGDRLSNEFRSLGANLVVTPEADSLPLEIGGVDYRPVNAGAYLPEADLPKLKTIFWHNNIVGFAPILEVSVREGNLHGEIPQKPHFQRLNFIGTWSDHRVTLPDGGTFSTGIAKTNPWWRLDGSWFTYHTFEAVVGANLARRAEIGPGATITIMGPNDFDTPYFIRITGVISTGGPEDDAIVGDIWTAQRLARKPGVYRRLYVSALTKPEDDFARRDPKSMTGDELERWSCSPYVSSIAYTIKQVLPGTDVRVIRRVADGEGNILKRVQLLLWLVTGSALLAAALAVGASSAASILERRTEIGLMKALGAGSGTVGFLLAAEQLLLAFVGGGIGYSVGILLARLLGEKIFGTAPEPSLIVLLVILVLAVGVTLAGSAIPLRRASRYEPAPILRGE
jgi:putative ABC transport system permease protein